MIVKLGQTLDGVNVLNKTITPVDEINMRLPADYDVLDPTITITRKPDIDYKSVNMCEFVELGRVYRVQEVELIGSLMVRFKLELDPLETYKTEILTAKARFYRNIKSGDYVNGSLDTSTKKTVLKIQGNVEIGTEPHTIMTTIRGNTR